MQKTLYYFTSIFRLLFGFKEWWKIILLFFKQEDRQGVIIHLRRENVAFCLRNFMDVWSVKETFLDRFYERYGTKIADGWTVVEVGAAIGDFAIFAALGYPNNQVIAFEPFPFSFETLQKNIFLNRIENILAYQEAIGTETGRLALNVSGGDPLQYTTEKSAPEADTIAVASTSLKDVFERQNLKHCDLLKLDCEGAEYGILFNAPDEILGRIERIIMEIHEGLNQYKRQDMVNFLIARGYRVSVTSNAVHSNLGYLYAHRN